MLGKLNSSGIFITVWDPIIQGLTSVQEVETKYQGEVLLPSALTGEMQSCLLNQKMEIPEGLEDSAVTQNQASFYL